MCLKVTPLLKKWKVIRSCIPRRETTQQVYTKDLKEVADEFNQFFTSVGARASKASRSLLNVHNLVPLLAVVPDDEISEVDKFCFHPVFSREIQKILRSLPSNKAPGHDKVSTSVLKEALPRILPILTVIVNRSLLTSVFPSVWKKSEVVPLLKGGDHEIANNNRPVSLLPVASKVCERVALNQLATYMNNHRRLTEHQSGNKKLHSCEILNVTTTDKVLEAMDSKKLTLVVLMDLSKAFDSIDHRRLLSKLQALGIGRTALERFRCYLTGCQQYVRISSETSNLGPITHGVTQGSILGPALFNLYINDLPTIPESGSLESFVDDSKLYLSFPVKDATAVVQLINEDLAKIATWCSYNGLLINPDKIKLLVMGNRQMLLRLLKDFHVTLLGKEVTPSNSARDLEIEMYRNGRNAKL